MAGKARVCRTWSHILQRLSCGGTPGHLPERNCLTAHVARGGSDMPVLKPRVVRVGLRRGPSHVAALILKMPVL